MALLRPTPDAAPLVGAAPPMTIRQVVRRFWPDVRPLRWWLLLLVVLLVGAPLIAVLEIVLFQKLVDDVLVPATLGPLVWIAALYVGLNLLSAVISGVDDYLSTWISQKFLVGLRTKVVRPRARATPATCTTATGSATRCRGSPRTPRRSSRS